MATLKYETETCGRCGGSGHYSYCQRFGTVCFKCGGRKIALSKAGAKASAAVQAFIAERFSVTVEDLKAGDRITYEGKGRTIESIETDNGAKYGIGKTESGDTIWENYITITFAKPIKTAFGPVSSHGFCKGTKVVKAPGGADWDAVVAFARTIKKGVTIVEEAK